MSCGCCITSGTTQKELVVKVRLSGGGFGLSQWREEPGCDPIHSIDRRLTYSLMQVYEFTKVNTHTAQYAVLPVQLAE